MDRVDLAAELERHHRESYGWALHCCAGDATLAEDVLHDAYQKVLDGRARYDGRASFKTWLLSVVRITAAQERRRSLLGRIRLELYAKRAGRHGQDQADDCLDRAETLDELPPVPWQSSVLIAEWRSPTHFLMSTPDEVVWELGQP